MDDKRRESQCDRLMGSAGFHRDIPWKVVGRAEMAAHILRAKQIVVTDGFVLCYVDIDGKKHILVGDEIK